METQELKQETFIADIPQDLARAAYNGTSMSPERRGDNARQEYAERMASDYNALLELAQRHNTTDLLPEEFARYREGYSKRYRAYLYSSSRCVSSFIAGPSNFPAARMNKRADIAHKRLNEFIEFRERALKAIRRTLCPTLGPIMSGDANAVERLTAKIAEAEKSHAEMKAINDAHKRFLKNPASLDSAPFDEPTKIMIRNYKPAYSWEPHPFAPYQFQNSSANIRRMKERLEQISAAKQETTQEIQGDNARFEDCPAENRVRLFYPGKPDEQTRTRLKSSGFRWSPTIGCWQAYRNHSTIHTAKHEAGIIAKDAANLLATLNNAEAA